MFLYFCFCWVLYSIRSLGAHRKGTYLFLGNKHMRTVLVPYHRIFKHTIVLTMCDIGRTVPFLMVMTYYNNTHNSVRIKQIHVGNTPTTNGGRLCTAKK